MKTSLIFLATMMLAAAADAAPLSPGMSMAIGAGVAAANQLQATAAPRLTLTPLTPSVTLVVRAAPTPVFVAPAVRAR